MTQWCTQHDLIAYIIQRGGQIKWLFAHQNMDARWLFDMINVIISYQSTCNQQKCWKLEVGKVAYCIFSNNWWCLIQRTALQLCANSSEHSGSNSTYIIVWFWFGPFSFTEALQRRTPKVLTNTASELEIQNFCELKMKPNERARELLEYYRGHTLLKQETSTSIARVIIIHSRIYVPTASHMWYSII